MKKLAMIAVALIGAAWGAQTHAFNCPKSPENYQEEISALRRQQEPLNDRINRTSDTETAIVLTNQSIALEERISAIEHRMFECDAIGQSILKDVKD